MYLNKLYEGWGTGRTTGKIGEEAQHTDETNDNKSGNGRKVQESSKLARMGTELHIRKRAKCPKRSKNIHFKKAEDKAASAGFKLHFTNAAGF